MVNKLKELNELRKTLKRFLTENITRSVGRLFGVIIYFGKKDTYCWDIFNDSAILIKSSRKIHKNDFFVIEIFSVKTHGKKQKLFGIAYSRKLLNFSSQHSIRIEVLLFRYHARSHHCVKWRSCQLGQLSVVPVVSGKNCFINFQVRKTSYCLINPKLIDFRMASGYKFIWVSFFLLFEVSVNQQK